MYRCDCTKSTYYSITLNTKKLDSMHLSHLQINTSHTTKNNGVAKQFSYAVGNWKLWKWTKWRTIETHAKNFVGKFTQFVHIFMQFFDGNLLLRQMNAELITNKCKKYSSQTDKQFQHFDQKLIHVSMAI